MILDSLSPSPEHDRHRGFFPDRLLGAINTGDFAVSISAYSDPELAIGTTSSCLIVYSTHASSCLVMSSKMSSIMSSKAKRLSEENLFPHL